MIKYIDYDGKEKIFLTKEEFEALKQFIPFIAYNQVLGMLYTIYKWQQKNGKSNKNKENEESNKQRSD